MLLRRFDNWKLFTNIYQRNNDPKQPYAVIWDIENRCFDTRDLKTDVIKDKKVNIITNFINVIFIINLNLGKTLEQHIPSQLQYCLVSKWKPSEVSFTTASCYSELRTYRYPVENIITHNLVYTYYQDLNIKLSYLFLTKTIKPKPLTIPIQNLQTTQFKIHPKHHLKSLPQPLTHPDPLPIAKTP